MAPICLAVSQDLGSTREPRRLVWLPGWVSIETPSTLTLGPAHYPELMAWVQAVSAANVTVTYSTGLGILICKATGLVALVPPHHTTLKEMPSDRGGLGSNESMSPEVRS